MTAAVPKPEGRCSGELCWYTLPLVDGLIVEHSKAGTLDDCEGAGRPPLTAAVPGPRFRDQLAEVLDDEILRQTLYTRDGARKVASALLPVIVAEVQPRVQAAAAQRVVEEIGEALSIAATRSPLDAVAWMSRRAAVLAQPTEDAS